jgi:hypothetical protein
VRYTWHIYIDKSEIDKETFNITTVLLFSEIFDSYLTRGEQYVKDLGKIAGLKSFVAVVNYGNYYMLM